MLIYLSQILEQSLLFFPLVLGIYLNFSILRITDLTVDGSFILGAAIFSRLITLGSPLILAISASILGGALAGLAVGLVQKNNKIDPLIAGILMAFMLHSLSLIIMQRPNIGLLDTVNIFAGFNNKILVLAPIILIISLASGLLLSSPIGLRLKAFGNNQQLLLAFGFNPENLRLLGLSLSNALAALSGCLTAQASGYADINMGLGLALIGIAMILIGRQLINICKIYEYNHDLILLIFTFTGVFLYFVLTNEIIRLGLDPIYLKLAIGGFLLAFLLISSKAQNLRNLKI